MLETGNSTVVFCWPYRSVDWEKHRPGNETTQEADDDEQLEVTDEQVAIDGLVVENVFVLDAAEVLDPTKEAVAGRGCLAPTRQLARRTGKQKRGSIMTYSSPRLST